MNKALSLSYFKRFLEFLFLSSSSSISVVIKSRKISWRDISVEFYPPPFHFIMRFSPPFPKRIDHIVGKLDGGRALSGIFIVYCRPIKSTGHLFGERTLTTYLYTIDSPYACIMVEMIESFSSMQFQPQHFSFVQI